LKFNHSLPPILFLGGQTQGRHNRESGGRSTLPVATPTTMDVMPSPGMPTLKDSRLFI